MKYFAVLTITVLFFSCSLYAQDYDLSSPDGQIQLNIYKQPDLHFTLKKGGNTSISRAKISMTLNNGKTLAQNDKIRKAKKTSVNTDIHPVVAIKNQEIPDHYNQLRLQFKGKYNIIFRVYNDAVAYRFETNFKDSIIVKNEQFSPSFPQGASAWFSFLEGKDNVHDRWMNAYEHLYHKEPLNTLSDKRTELPLVIAIPGEGKILLTESDLK